MKPVKSRVDGDGNVLWMRPPNGLIVELRVVLVLVVVLILSSKEDFKVNVSFETIGSVVDRFRARRETGCRNELEVVAKNFFGHRRNDLAGGQVMKRQVLLTGKVSPLWGGAECFNSSTSRAQACIGDEAIGLD